MGGNKENKDNKESRETSAFKHTFLLSSSEKYLGLLNGSSFSFFFINQVYNFSLILLLLFFIVLNPYINKSCTKRKGKKLEEFFVSEFKGSGSRRGTNLKFLI